MADASSPASLGWWAAPAYREADWTSATVSSSLLFQAVLLLQLLVLAWESYLHWRQRRVLQSGEFPAQLAKALETIDQKPTIQSHAKVPARAQALADEPQSEPPSSSEASLLVTNVSQTRAYDLDKNAFALASGVLREAAVLASLLLGFLPFAWSLSAEILTRLGLDPTSHEVARALAMVSLTALHDGAMALPFSLYSTFVIEARHGFNRQSLATFATDKLKLAAVVTVFLYPLTAFFILFIRWAGDAFFLYLPVVVPVVMSLFFTLVPLIAPLIETCRPLQDGPLRTKISQLAAKLSFPPKNILVSDNSTRSSHSNAAILGLGRTKTIYLDDTLLQQVSEDEILAVLCHEIGHSQRWHFHRGMASSMAVDFVKFFVFAKCLYDPTLLTAFGFATATTAKPPVVVGYLLFSVAVWAPLGPILKFLGHYTSRKLEFEADEFAVDQGFGQSLQSGLTKLYAANMMTVQFDPLYSSYHNHHPPLLERLEAIDTRDTKRQ